MGGLIALLAIFALGGLIFGGGGVDEDQGRGDSSWPNVGGGFWDGKPNGDMENFLDFLEDIEDWDD